METQAVGDADDSNAGPPTAQCPLCSNERPLTKLRLIPGLRMTCTIAVCEDCA